MKKTDIFIVILLTYYFAGMYRSLPLMVMCVGELLFLGSLFILARYFKRRVSVFFPETGKCTDEGAETQCHISVQNRSRLPVSRIELRLRTRYPQERKYTRTKLYGSAGYGESSLAFCLSAEYCGMAHVRMDRLRVFDHLALFGAGKRLDQEMTIAVFPKEEAFHIELSEFDRENSMLREDWPIDRRGSDHDEIRQIREYRNGDSERYIHWNQSAKTDSLWIREYERRMDHWIHILVDSTGFSHASAMEMSAFYRTLSALVLGFLQEGVMVRVHWHHSGRAGFMNVDVEDAGQCKDMLLMLYRTDFSNWDEARTDTGLEYTLRLTVELSLFKKDALIYQFSAEELDSKIREVVLRI